MDGLMYTINKLGLTLAAAEARIAELEQENSVLSQQLKPLDQPGL